MDLSKYQSYNESNRAYLELYKTVASKNPKWLHYALLRIAGETRAVAYVGAGYKSQGVSFSGGSLDSTNAIHIEKKYPIVVDLIQMGKHRNMLKLLDDQKDRILTPEERMIMMSSVALGNLETTDKKKINTIRKGKKVTSYVDVISSPNLNQKMKAIDILNKMDSSYQQTVIIKKDADADIREMTTEELMNSIKNLDEMFKKK